MKVKELVVNALFIAIVFVATRFIAVDTGLGYYHAGDGVIFAIAVVFGLKSGVIAGAIGMGLSDFLSGTYAAYTIPTILIKTIMVVIVIQVMKKIGEKYSQVGMVIAGLVGAIGYFAFEAVYYADVAAASGYIIFNVAQASIVGALIATLLIPLLKRVK